MRALILFLALSSFAPLSSANIDKAAKVFARHGVSQTELTQSLLVCRVEVKGKSGGWDAFGNAPDVRLTLRAAGARRVASDRNRFVSHLSFAGIDLKKGEQVSVVLVDKDDFFDDAIGTHALVFERTPFKIKSTRFSLECRSIDEKVVAKKIKTLRANALKEAQSKRRVSKKEMVYACRLDKKREFKNLRQWSGEAHPAYAQVKAARERACADENTRARAEHEQLLSRAHKVGEAKVSKSSSIKVSEAMPLAGKECAFEVEVKNTLGFPKIELYDAEAKRKHIRRVSPASKASPMPVNETSKKANKQKVSTPKRINEKVQFATPCKGIGDALLYVLDIEGRTLKKNAFRLSED